MSLTSFLLAERATALNGGLTPSLDELPVWLDACAAARERALATRAASLPELACRLHFLIELLRDQEEVSEATLEDARACLQDVLHLGARQ